MTIKVTSPKVALDYILARDESKILKINQDIEARITKWEGLAPITVQVTEEQAPSAYGIKKIVEAYDQAGWKVSFRANDDDGHGVRNLGYSLVLNYVPKKR